MMGKISIIIPIYNSERYLNKCIESILCQTYKNLEIILIDDGSSDRSNELCNYYKERDDRITLITQENLGQAEARNEGLRVASGDYIGFVDSDDWIAENMYEMMITNIVRYKADIVVCGRYNVEEATGNLTSKFTMESPLCLNSQEALHSFFMSDHMDGATWDKLFRREIIQESFFPKGYICEDIPFVYSAIKKAKVILHIGIPLYYYLQREGSTSHSAFSQKSMGALIYAKMIYDDVVKNFGDFEPEAKYFYCKHLFYIMSITNHKDRKENGIICRVSDFDRAFFPFRTRLTIALIKIGIYNPLRTLWHKIKKH